MSLMSVSSSMTSMRAASCMQPIVTESVRAWCEPSECLHARMARCAFGRASFLPKASNGRRSVAAFDVVAGRAASSAFGFASGEGEGLSRFALCPKAEVALGFRTRRFGIGLPAGLCSPRLGSCPPSLAPPADALPATPSTSPCACVRLAALREICRTSGKTPPSRCGAPLPTMGMVRQCAERHSIEEKGDAVCRKRRLAQTMRDGSSSCPSSSSSSRRWGRRATTGLSRSPRRR